MIRSQCISVGVSFETEERMNNKEKWAIKLKSIKSIDWSLLDFKVKRKTGQKVNKIKNQ